MLFLIGIASSLFSNVLFRSYLMLMRGRLDFLVGFGNWLGLILIFYFALCFSKFISSLVQKYALSVRICTCQFVRVIFLV